MVSSVHCIYEGRKLRTMGCQISMLPWPRTTIFLADATAIKVRDTVIPVSNWMCLIFNLWFSGGDIVSCQVSQTRPPIFDVEGVWG